ncbi:23S rRNA pseudouridine2604 synthase [Modicisalibacter muralis]|uniref:Dual-specificity RNA pseudouridine synthase RluF n=1 Tax=Modicisalibacter muralis TaxID=119000 RepID=A0A1G9FH80_9GAMM|nr:rRNA pseudouridine synthase [Halomonas muralis]SDK87739.1 23S rRNA pseudouridine2604 synthase [Halomonas muralis]
MSDRVRLSKHLAALLPCSRREAEQYIAGGWVLVDGEVVEEPQFKVDTQAVTLAPGARLEPIVPATILLHLPPGHDNADGDSIAKRLITPASRATNDVSGIRPLKAHFSRLTLAAPLERGASGLSVFTQDHRVIRKLKDDISRIEQEIVVEVSGTPTENGLERLARGVRFEGRILPPAKVSWQNETHLRFALKGLCPGHIALMCQSVGLRMLAMKRLRLGRVPLAKLAPGEWRYLPADKRF